MKNGCKKRSKNPTCPQRQSLVRDVVPKRHISAKEAACGWRGFGRDCGWAAWYACSQNGWRVLAVSMDRQTINHILDLFATVLRRPRCGNHAIGALKSTPPSIPEAPCREEGRGGRGGKGARNIPPNPGFRPHAEP